MGEVYRAKDMRLDRDVALKVLSPSVAARPEATLREILTALKIELSFSSVNKLRLWLTTNAFPFLRGAKEQ